MTQRFAEMNEQQFQKIIDGYIDRAAVGEVDVPANIFFDLLAQRLAAHVDETITIAVKIEANDLTLHPDREFADIVIRGNEIIIGHHRFVLQLSTPHNASPTPAL